MTVVVSMIASARLYRGECCIQDSLQPLAAVARPRCRAVRPARRRFDPFATRSVATIRRSRSPESASLALLSIARSNPRKQDGKNVRWSLRTTKRSVDPPSLVIRLITRLLTPEKSGELRPDLSQPQPRRRCSRSCAFLPSPTSICIARCLRRNANIDTASIAATEHGQTSLSPLIAVVAIARHAPHRTQISQEAQNVGLLPYSWAMTGSCSQPPRFPPRDFIDPSVSPRPTSMRQFQENRRSRPQSSVVSGHTSA